MKNSHAPGDLVVYRGSDGFSSNVLWNKIDDIRTAALVDKSGELRMNEVCLVISCKNAHLFVLTQGGSYGWKYETYFKTI